MMNNEIQLKGTLRTGIVRLPTVYDKVRRTIFAQLTPYIKEGIVKDESVRKALGLLNKTLFILFNKQVDATRECAVSVTIDWYVEENEVKFAWETLNIVLWKREQLNIGKILPKTDIKNLRIRFNGKNTRGEILFKIEGDIEGIAAVRKTFQKGNQVLIADVAYSIGGKYYYKQSETLIIADEDEQVDTNRIMREIENMFKDRLIATILLSNEKTSEGYQQTINALTA